MSTLNDRLLVLTTTPRSRLRGFSLAPHTRPADWRHRGCDL